MERVIEPRDRSRRVAERRMGGDVLDALPIDIDFAAIAQAFQVLCAGEGAPFGADGVLAFDPVHESLLDAIALDPTNRFICSQIVHRYDEAAGRPEHAIFEAPIASSRHLFVGPSRHRTISSRLITSST